MAKKTQRENETTLAMSDEAIIAALMSAPTFRAAAESLGTTERNIYERMHRAQFKQLYRTAKDEILRTAAQRLNSEMCAAIDTISEIMKEEIHGAKVRLKAAQMLLDYSARFAERLDGNECQAEELTKSVFDGEMIL